MASRRTSRLRRAYLKQRKQRLDEIRHRDLIHEAQSRAQPRSETFLKAFGIKLPDDLTSDIDDARREKLKLVQLEGNTSSREEILARCNRIADNTEVVFKLGNTRMYLIRAGDKFYLLYREVHKFYKISVGYGSRTKAMREYEDESIIWMQFVSETVGSK